MYLPYAVTTIHYRTETVDDKTKFRAPNSVPTSRRRRVMTYGLRGWTDDRRIFHDTCLGHVCVGNSYNIRVYSWWIIISNTYCVQDCNIVVLGRP